MRVLVTGANGFVGRAVLAHQAARAWALRAHAGPGPVDKDARVDGEWVKADITDIERLRPLAEGVDVLIHLAGPASVAASFSDPQEYLRVHVLGAEAVVRLCSEAGIGRVVHVSSAEVYGRPRCNPVREDALPAPRSPYGAAKLGAEAVVGAAARAGGLDAVVLRPFSLYGPGQRADALLSCILQQAVQGDTISLRDLAPVRDYCYVGDLAGAVWQAATLGAAPGPRTFNIASGRAVSVGALAATVGDALGRVLSVSRRPDPDRPAGSAVPELVGDTASARRILGWQATTSLRDGLRLTLEWYRMAEVVR